MADQKKKIILSKMIVSPQGIARYPHLRSPDTQFGKDDYHMDLILEDNEETAAFLEQVRKAGEEVAAKSDVKLKKNYRVNADVDDMIDNAATDEKRQELKDALEGKVLIRTNSKFQPGTFDAAGNKIPAKKIWGGDGVRIAVKIGAYSAFGSGLSFKLQSVQLIEKNSAEPGENPFGAVDGGYVADDDQDDEDVNDGSSGEDDDDTPEDF